jgi:hypothetical protein
MEVPGDKPELKPLGTDHGQPERVPSPLATLSELSNNKCDLKVTQGHECEPKLPDQCSLGADSAVSAPNCLTRNRFRFPSVGISDDDRVQWLPVENLAAFILIVSTDCEVNTAPHGTGTILSIAAYRLEHVETELVPCAAASLTEPRLRAESQRQTLHELGHRPISVKRTVHVCYAETQLCYSSTANWCKAQLQHLENSQGLKFSQRWLWRVQGYKAL